MHKFELNAAYEPVADQPKAREYLSAGIEGGDRFQTLLGVTGSGKTATMAFTIEQVQRPSLVIAHNKTLATITTSRRANSALVAAWRRRSISSLIDESFSM